MFLGEPTRTAYDLNFRLGDVPIRVHPLFWLVAIILGSSVRDPKLLLIWVVVIFFSILIHELGHVLAFRYYGISAHVVLYSFGGLAVPGGGFRPYGQSSRGDRGFSRIMILLAGPGAGFVVAAAVIAILFAVNRSIDFSLMGFTSIRLGMGPRLFPAMEGVSEELLAQANVSMIPMELYFLITQLLFVNIVWGLVNLLPVYPLDGGQASRELFLMGNPGQGVHHSLMLSMFVGVGIAAWFAKEQDWYIALMFGFLAYQSYQAMQMNRGGWGGGYGGGGYR